MDVVIYFISDLSFLFDIKDVKFHFTMDIMTEDEMYEAMSNDPKGCRVEPGLYCAVDPGLRSPCYVFYVYPMKITEIFCFAKTKTQKKRHAGYRFQISTNAYVQMLPPLEEKDQSLVITQAIETFKDIAMSLQQKYNIPMGHVFLEDVAYKAQSSSTTVLARWQGVIEHECRINRWPMTKLSISHVKNKFAGHGKASKLKMYEAYIYKNFTDCSPYVGCSYDQNPNEDIIDACAILYVGLSTDKAKIAF